MRAGDEEIPGDVEEDRNQGYVSLGRVAHLYLSKEQSNAAWIHQELQHQELQLLDSCIEINMLEPGCYSGRGYVMFQVDIPLG